MFHTILAALLARHPGEVQGPGFLLWPARQRCWLQLAPVPACWAAQQPWAWPL